MHRIETYDLLRGIAILGVLAVHIGHAFPTGLYIIDKALGFGAKGVQLFFFVSALTMCYMWRLRHQETNIVGKFYIRRFMRIAPLFWLAMGFYLYNGEGYKEAHQIFLTATFLHGFWPDSINSVVPGGWSIAVEMIFYLIFPIVIIVFRSHAYSYLLAAMVLYFLNQLVFTPFGHYILEPLVHDHDDISDFFYMWFFNQAPIFFLGCFIFFYLEGKQDFRAPPNNGLAWLGLAWLGLAVLIDLYTKNFSTLFLVSYISIGIIVLFSVRHNFSLKPIEVLGKNSYAIYLSHFYMIDVLVKNIKLSEFGWGGITTFTAGFTMVLVASLIISRLLYFSVEQPSHILTKKMLRSF